MTWTTRQRSEGPGRLAFWHEGGGAALVLIHGVGLRAEAWAGMMPVLSQHYGVYAVDIPGHGGSPLVGVASLDDYVARFFEFAEALDGPVLVAGHSMGAIIAIKLATALPEKVTALAALNTIYRRSPEAACAVKARATALGNAASDPAHTLARWFGETPTGNIRACAQACRTWLTEADPEGYATAYRAFADQDGPADDLLTNLTTHALFMTAENDLNSTPEMSQAMAILAPQGRAHVVADAAHMMPMTHPQEAAALMLQTFREAA